MSENLKSASSRLACEHIKLANSLTPPLPHRSCMYYFSFVIYPRTVKVITYGFLYVAYLYCSLDVHTGELLLSTIYETDTDSVLTVTHIRNILELTYIKFIQIGHSVKKKKSCQSLVSPPGEVKTVRCPGPLYLY